MGHKVNNGEFKIQFYFRLWSVLRDNGKSLGKCSSFYFLLLLTLKQSLVGKAKAE